MEKNDPILKKQLDQVPGNVIVTMVFGSHLYGLSTPESDYDYKGVFIPPRREWVLGKAPKSIDFSTGDNVSRNGADDLDISFTSILKFIEDALRGEVFAIDMLHCENPITSTPTWEHLRANRTKFYSKSMKAYIGYLKRQVHKYGVKGSRMSELETVFKSIGVVPMDKNNSRLVGRVEDVLKRIPFDKLEHIEHKPDDKVVVVLGKKFGYRAHIHEMIHSMERVYDNYGARAKEARDNKGLDWKAISHALRAGYQQRDIFMNGDFSYPLKENKFLLDVKTGKLDFLTEVQPILEDLIEQIYQLADDSNLPEKPERKFWEDFIFDTFNSPE